MNLENYTIKEGSVNDSEKSENEKISDEHRYAIGIMQGEVEILQTYKNEEELKQGLREWKDYSERKCKPEPIVLEKPKENYWNSPGRMIRPGLKQRLLKEIQES